MCYFVCKMYLDMYICELVNAKSSRDKSYITVCKTGGMWKVTKHVKKGQSMWKVTIMKGQYLTLHCSFCTVRKQILIAELR